MTSTAAAAERLYALVANEEDARLCADIPDAACREVPGNFFRILASLVLTNVGDMLASPKVVLAWLLGAVGAPAALVSWLVPVRVSGSLMPQLLIGAWVRRHARRARFWVLGSVAQGVCVAGIAGAVWWLDGVAAGSAVIALLSAFSLARGFCSVAMKDVQGKTIPKARRGRLGGLAGTAAACVATAALGWVIPASSWLSWVVIPAYFVLSIAHAGVRIGRKTYLVDMAGGNKRTDYVAVSNTAIGLALLAMGGLSGLASVVSVETALALLGVMGVAGVMSARALHEAQR